ncbi:MAG TPA: phosphate ABC transporter substrate-binding protein PstS [Acidimicrobiales bacterium]|jgi:phosphate transport system substrate-binding protein|nr:phosphate ABC transporter substrate-binding protein PstS [Acidimicrobiales bacterium]
MPGKRRRPLMAVAALAALTLAAGACGSSKNSSSSTTTNNGSTTTTIAVPAATLNGSGSTFQQAFDQEDIQEFHGVYGNVTVNYAGGGSSKGLTDLQNKLVNFAGTDAPIKDYTPYGGASAVLYFPTVAGPITVSYNLASVSKTLVLSGPTLAKIFAGKITTWNDPAITADNSGVTLPSTKITPVHRSDGSGTTHNFTLYLGKVDPTDWTFGNSTTFPTTLGGATGNGNPGVAQTVQSTDGAIGYVDYATAVAAGLKYASVKNYAGEAVAPTLDAASKAIAGVTPAADLTYDPTDVHAPGAYPITAPTWIVTYKTQTDHAAGLALKAFLSFTLTTGETRAAKAAQYAPLAGTLLTMAQSQVNNLTIP